MKESKYEVKLTIFLNKNINKGFTLSELMVTLGVIGVLGAIVIPAVRKNVPSQNRVMFKKAYMITEKAVSDLLNDENLYPESNIDATTTLPIDFAEDGTGHNFCVNFMDRLNTVGAVSCPTQINNGLVNEIATTADGIVWYMGGAYGTQSVFKVKVPGSRDFLFAITVDVNGKANGPNCMSDTLASVSERHVLPSGATKCVAEKNPDIYTINVAYDGAIRTGNIKTTESQTEITNSVAQEIMSNQTKNTSD